MTQPEQQPLALADHVVGAGTPMLLLHGGTGSHRHWVRITAALARHFRVHAPDLPGYGDSPDVPIGRDIPMRGYKEIDGSLAARREVAHHNLQAMMLADPASIDDEAIDQQLWNVAHSRYNSLRVSHRDCLIPDLSRLRCPLQVIWGAADPMAHPSPAARAERVRRACPDARLEFVPGGSHWVQYERPDDIVRLLINFHAPAAAAPTEQK